MLKTKKINKIKVKPIPVKKIDTDKIKGYDMFPEIYANIFLCAKKKSGKTSCVSKILKECVNKDTRVFIFCPTHRKDESYKHIANFLDSKDIRYEMFDNIIEDKIDNLELIYGELIKEYGEEENEEIKNKDNFDPELFEKYINDHSICNFVDEEDCFKVVVKKKRKPKKIAPEIIFLFDDVSNQLKTPSIARLLKTNRHFKSKVIISSQWPNDVHPDGRNMFDYWLLWGGHSFNKIETIHTNASLPIDLEEFYSIYINTTKNKFNFLYVDTVNNKYRKNFDEEIIM